MLADATCTGLLVTFWETCTVTLVGAAGLFVTVVEVCEVPFVELLVILAIKRQQLTIKSTVYQLYKIHTQY